MSGKKEKVIVAMSGGVDSSVAAALLLEQGFDVRGLILKLWSAEDSGKSFEKAKEQASLVAGQLGIQLDVIDAVSMFLNRTVGYFIESHKSGITPNPCYKCNREIKWMLLVDYANKMNSDYVASGHYARLIRRGDEIVELRKALDLSKDQSYVLSGLNQDQLRKAILPLGNIKKIEIREIAHRYHFDNYDREDSQDLCFLAGMKQEKFFEQYAPEMRIPGQIKNTVGELIGTHTGLNNYTIGQRKGIGSGNKEPLYVIGKDISKNELIVGKSTDLGSRQLIAGEMNWISGIQPEFPINCEVKIRYRANPVSCSIHQRPDYEVLIKFDQTVRDATPGQIAVLYAGDLVIGSGVIQRVIGEGE